MLLKTQYFNEIPFVLHKGDSRFGATFSTSRGSRKFSRTSFHLNPFLLTAYRSLLSFKPKFSFRRCFSTKMPQKHFSYPPPPRPGSQITVFIIITVYFFEEYKIIWVSYHGDSLFKDLKSLTDFQT